MELKIQREALGEYVRAQRASRRLTQHELADEAGVSRRTLATVEADEDGPGVETVAKILAALECPPEIAGRIVTLTLSPAPVTVPTDGAGEGVP